MAGHHNGIRIDHRKQFFDSLDHPAQRSSGRFVDHGVAAIGEKIAHDEHTLLEGRKTTTSPSVCAGACGNNRNCSDPMSSMIGWSNVRVGQALRGAAEMLHESDGTCW